MIRGALLGAAVAGLDVSANAQAATGGTASAAPVQDGGEARWTRMGELVVERAAEGKPHAGKVLAAIQPHADDVPLFAGGTVAKLIREGYTGYLIRVTNDEMTGGGTRGEGVLHNEQDNDAVARALGLRKSYNLAYRNHRMDEMSPQDLRGNLILLFRMLRVDTVVSYDHWGLYEENPDHYVTAAAVESACWMAGMAKDYPEQLEAGLKPHSVMEKYYYARGPQIANRVVDISGDVKQKIASIQAIGTQGPGGSNGARLRQRLAERKLRLPVLGDDDATANLNYVEHFVLDEDSMHTRGVPSDKEIGAPYGFAWAERFRYVGPNPSRMEEYIAKNAVTL
ncbi:MAG: PIG-L family deacetylase [Acidobacteria bacterium]|nr:PIG-L family deacetylase [Acidobacteriota bacterium]